MPDHILIKNLRVDAILGIKPQERVEKQELLINVQLYVDIGAPAASDNIDDAVNYRTVTKRIIAHVQASQNLLVERLATELAQIVLDEFAVERVVLRVEKPGALRFAESVGVEVDRSRKSDG